jgi:hypothetical protein
MNGYNAPNDYGSWCRWPEGYNEPSDWLMSVTDDYNEHNEWMNIMRLMTMAADVGDYRRLQWAKWLADLKDQMAVLCLMTAG